MLSFKLATSNGLKYDGEAYEITLPTKAGPVSIFEDHMPMISAALPGILGVRKKSNDGDNDMEKFAINGGVIEVDGKTVSFVADEVTAAEDITEHEAAAAVARAEDLVKNAETQTELHEAHRVLQHSSAQLQLAKLKSRHHN